MRRYAAILRLRDEIEADRARALQEEGQNQVPHQMAVAHQVPVPSSSNNVVDDNRKPLPVLPTASTSTSRIKKKATI